MTAMESSLSCTINESIFFNLCHIDDKGSRWADCGTLLATQSCGRADVNVTTETHEVILAPVTTTTAGTRCGLSCPEREGHVPTCYLKNYKTDNSLTTTHVWEGSSSSSDTHTHADTHTHTHTHMGNTHLQPAGWACCQSWHIVVALPSRGIPYQVEH